MSTKPQSPRVAKEEEAAAPVSPPVADNDDAKSSKSNSNEIKELVASLKELTQKRRVFRQVQLNYSRIRKNFFKHIQP